MSVYESIFLAAMKGKAKYAVLLDPDKLDEKSGYESARRCTDAGVDCLFVGGSTGERSRFVAVTHAIKSGAGIPLILFPGSAEHIVPHADAVLFMSLISGRNPRFLIDEPLKGVPAIRNAALETIGMGYILVESDKPSAVERVSGTSPIKRDHFASAVNHSLMAQYFGMKVVYLEGGSGVELPVPVQMVAEVRTALSVPLIVGGGIKTASAAKERVLAGANVIVTGNVLEKTGLGANLDEFIEAIHSV